MARDSSTLLLRPDKAGDAIKTLPALRALRAEFPLSEIHILASEHNVSLFEYEPGIKLHVLPKNWHLMPKEKWLSHLGFSSLFARFEKIVNLLCDESQEADVLLATIPAALKYTTHPKKSAFMAMELPDASPVGRDESLNIALLLSQAFDADLTKRLYFMPTAPMLSTKDILEANEKMGHKEGRWLGICPMAGLAQRTLPLSRWPRFLDSIMKKNSFEKYFIFGAPSEATKLTEIRDRVKVREKIVLCFPSSFRALGAYLQRLDGVVAVDSGPLHFARALGIRSLGVLSGGDMKRWFHPAGKGNFFVKRGLFSRYPSAFEMYRGYSQWHSSLTEIR